MSIVGMICGPIADPLDEIFRRYRENRAFTDEGSSAPRGSLAFVGRNLALVLQGRFSISPTPSTQLPRSRSWMSRRHSANRHAPIEGHQQFADNPDQQLEICLKNLRRRAARCGARTRADARMRLRVPPRIVRKTNVRSSRGGPHCPTWATGGNYRAIKTAAFQPIDWTERHRLDTLPGPHEDGPQP